MANDGRLLLEQIKKENVNKRMAYITLTAIERGKRETKSGKWYDGLLVSGIKEASKFNPQEQPWEKFLFDFGDGPAQQKLFDGFGAGDRVNVKSVKNPSNPNFWVIAEVTSLDGRQPSNPLPPHDPAPTPAPAPQPVQAPAVVSQVQEFPRFDEIAVKVAAIDKAVNLTTGMLRSGESFSKLFKKTVTPNVIENYMFDLSDKIENRLNGESSDGVHSDSSDLKEATDYNEPEIPDVG